MSIFSARAKRGLGALVLSLILLGGFSLVTPLPVFAQVCAGGCPANYTCSYDTSHVAACIQDCTRDASGACTVDEVVVTAASSPNTFAKVVGRLVAFTDYYLIPHLYALAFIVFLIGIVRFYFTGGEENRTKGKTFVLWSSIAFVVLFGFWGILNLLLSALPH